MGLGGQAESSEVGRKKSSLSDRAPTSKVGRIESSSEGRAKTDEEKREVFELRRAEELKIAEKAKREKQIARINEFRSTLSGIEEGQISERTRKELLEKATQLEAGDIDRPEARPGDVTPLALSAIGIDQLITGLEGELESAVAGEGKFGRRQKLEERFKVARETPGLRQQTVGGGGSLLFGNKDKGLLG